MKNFIFLFSAMLFASVFSFAGNLESKSVDTSLDKEMYEQTWLEQSSSVLFQDVLNDDCFSFPATLSCGIEVTVSGCGISSLGQIGTALLIADAIMCNFRGISEVIVEFP